MYGAGAAFFCLGPEPTQFGRSRSDFRSQSRPKKWRLRSEKLHGKTLIIVGKYSEIFYYRSNQIIVTCEYLSVMCGSGSAFEIL